MKFILILCLVGFGLQVNAQSHRITGRLMDQENRPVSYAGVYLFSSVDSVHKNAVQSDSAGYFQITAGLKGQYLVKVRYIGYQSYTSGIFELNEPGSLFPMGNIQLKEDSHSLQTVQISGARPMIEQRMDKMVMNVENSILSKGSTALELLSKLPSVTVDESGSVSLKGRPGTQVMINGKLTYLSASQLANLLRGTASDGVAKVELMSNPSSRYDAAGKGGIINIVMKKNVKNDLNGNLSMNGGAGKRPGLVQERTSTIEAKKSTFLEVIIISIRTWRTPHISNGNFRGIPFSRRAKRDASVHKISGRGWICSLMKKTPLVFWSTAVLESILRFRIPGTKCFLVMA